MGGSATTSNSDYYSYNAEDGVSNVDSYEGNGTPGNLATDGKFSSGFQLWMVATAISVGMALTAIYIGQQKNRAVDDSPVGKNVTGSVNRRLSAVSAFADGVMGSTGGAKQVELKQYQLSDPSYPQSSFV